jgi:CHASE2 domain-containing sensor protein
MAVGPDDRVTAPKRTVPTQSLIVLTVALIGIAALLFYPPALKRNLDKEQWTQDWRTIFLSERGPDTYPYVVIVAIDAATRQLYAENTPTNRNMLADLVTRIDRAGAAAIGLDIYYWKATQNDDVYLKALHDVHHADVILAAKYREALEEQKQFQSEFLAKSGKKAGYISFAYDQNDFVVRHRSIEPDNPDFPLSFSELLARAFRPTACVCSTRIAWLAPPRADVETFKRLSAREILTTDTTPGSALAAELKNRVVLIGTDVPNEDRWRTPLFFDSTRTVPGIEVHAQLVAELLDGRHVYELDRRAERFVICLLIAIGCYATWRLRSTRRQLASWRIAEIPVNWGILGVLFLGADALVYSQLHVSLPFTVCVAALFVGVTIGHHMRRMLDWVAASRKGAT